MSYNVKGEYFEYLGRSILCNLIIWGEIAPRLNYLQVKGHISVRGYHLCGKHVVSWSGHIIQIFCFSNLSHIKLVLTNWPYLTGPNMQTNMVILIVLNPSNKDVRTWGIIAQSWIITCVNTAKPRLSTCLWRQPWRLLLLPAGICLNLPW